MTWTLSNRTRSSMADALAADTDAGATPGILRIYGGSRPSTADTAVTSQPLLAQFTLASPAFSAAVNGVITLDADPDLETTAVATGTATWARLLDGDGQTVGDCKVTDQQGTGDIKLLTTEILTGMPVRITDGTLTMPAGTAD